MIFNEYGEIVVSQKKNNCLLESDFFHRIKQDYQELDYILNYTGINESAVNIKQWFKKIVDAIRKAIKWVVQKIKAIGSSLKLKISSLFKRKGINEKEFVEKYNEVVENEELMNQCKEKMPPVKNNVKPERSVMDGKGDAFLIFHQMMLNSEEMMSCVVDHACDCTECFFDKIIDNPKSFESFDEYKSNVIKNGTFAHYENAIDAIINGWSGADFANDFEDVIDKMNDFQYNPKSIWSVVINSDKYITDFNKSYERISNLLDKTLSNLDRKLDNLFHLTCSFNERGINYEWQLKLAIGFINEISQKSCKLSAIMLERCNRYVDEAYKLIGIVMDTNPKYFDGIE